MNKGHSHWITSDGVCLECNENVPITGTSVGATGMFEWDDEWFAWASIDGKERPQWEGFTEVLDSEDCVIAVGLTPYLAIRGAVEELNFAQESVDLMLEDLFQ